MITTMITTLGPQLNGFLLQVSQPLSHLGPNTNAFRLFAHLSSFPSRPNLPSLPLPSFSIDGSFTTSSPIEVPNAPYLISNGYVGHAIVLHSPSGAKISCGMILATSSPSPSLSSNDTLAAVLGVLSALFLLLIAYVCVRMKWYKGEQHLDAKDLLEQANMVEMNVRGSSGREGGGFLDNDSPAAV